MSNILGGLQGTAYLGTNANQPPNYFFENRDPVSTDVNASLGDFWLNKLDRRLFYLSSLAGNSTSAGSVALWILIGGASGDVESLTTDDATVVLPDLGNIFLAGGLNIFTDGVNDHAIVNLKTSILQPFTTADGSSGVYALGTTNNSTDRFMYAYGTGNTFLGRQAGNLSITVVNATDNTGIGFQSLLALTTGNTNTAVGSGAGFSITSGDGNVCIGSQSAVNLTTSDNNVCIGSESALNLTTGGDNIAIGHQALENALTGFRNVAIGFQAGNALDGAESDNIYLANTGVLGESDTIRIGTEGTQTAAYLAGVYGETVDADSKLVVVMDNTGKLGTSAGGAGGGIETVTANSGGAVSADGADNINIRGDGVTINAVGVPGTHTVTLSQIGGTGNPFAFSYVQTTDTGNQVDDSTYSLGKNVVLTKIFDDGNNVYPGSGAGAAATFTAPVTGRYYLEFYLNTNFATGVEFVQILTTARSYSMSPPSTGPCKGYSVVADMTAGDTATFNVKATSGGTNNWKILGNTGSPVYNTNSTRISGFLLPTSSNGGSFSQPFYYLQTANSVNVTGDGTTFVIGSDGNMTAQYDIGSNVALGVFTAPATGVYSFIGQIIYDQGAGGTVILQSAALVTTARSYINGILPASTLGFYFHVNTAMTAGDTAFLSLTNNYNPPGTKTHSVLASVTPSHAPFTTSCTYFQGFRIA